MKPRCAWDKHRENDMKIEQICWLREILKTDPTGQETVAFEFSCDSGYGRAPVFFPVIAADVPQARALYRELGGSRPDGYRIGTAVQGQGVPRPPSIAVWKQT